MTDEELIKRLRVQRTTDEMTTEECAGADYEFAYNMVVQDCREAADRIEEYAKAFANLQREYDARGERIEGLADPIVVHANMLRGTIAKPTVEQIIHLYGVSALVKALALAAAVPADLAEVGKVLEGVTPGPWEEITPADGIWPPRVFSGSSIITMVDNSDMLHAEKQANARFIAWCREGVPALIALATAQAARIEGLEKDRDTCPIGMSNDARDFGLCSAATCRVCLVRHMAAWRDRAEAAETALAAERAKVAKLVEAGKALGLREIVAGWNGEGKEKPYTPHPAHLSATIKTTCGAVYALDAAITEAGK